MQIGFFMSSADEALLALHVHGVGAVFLPSSYPEWPLPSLSTPLPPATQPYMGSLVIWHPEIFTPTEMALPESRAFNPHGKCFVSSVWPVIEFTRPRLDVLPQHQGRLYLDASEQSFRFARAFTQLTPRELTDFGERLRRLSKLYNHLGAWVRQHMVRVDRGLYCSASLESTIVPHPGSAPA